MGDNFEFFPPSFFVNNSSPWKAPACRQAGITRRVKIIFNSLIFKLEGYGYFNIFRRERKD
ncbi:hypothetical protein A3E04_00715 [Candidatus Kuenenbacteria bacterium RIFCSPHIGHO2_12_FULL_42_14]|uniref:Uncharacterized protein n=1 Tax=Candidatus Kuenenbacteria bacterium RIFCSPHIGHO2_12_FULL_42_14 TaxID=1798563 RepID=A0A1F6GKE0_9BACT|nr:MAG: hypothetical protein A3E04_00715 [Candidatus Kuenenbacteria bacterium RIFCSPHIGHO2_12_FULL_42_14]